MVVDVPPNWYIITPACSWPTSGFPASSWCLHNEGTQMRCWNHFDWLLSIQRRRLWRLGAPRHLQEWACKGTLRVILHRYPHKYFDITSTTKQKYKQECTVALCPFSAHVILDQNSFQTQSSVWLLAISQQNHDKKKKIYLWLFCALKFSMSFKEKVNNPKTRCGRYQADGLWWKLTSGMKNSRTWTAKHLRALLNFSSMLSQGSGCPGDKVVIQFGRWRICHLCF